MSRKVEEQTKAKAKKWAGKKLIGEEKTNVCCEWWAYNDSDLQTGGPEGIIGEILQHKGGECK